MAHTINRFVEACVRNPKKTAAGMASCVVAGAAVAMEYEEPIRRLINFFKSLF